MPPQSRYSRRHLVPALATAAVAAIGIAGFLFAHFGPKKNVQNSAISMRTTAVVEEAGAILIPTQPRLQAITQESSAVPQAVAD